VGLFDYLGTTQKTEKEISEGLNLKAPRLQDFLNYLVSIGLLTKDNDGKYGNSEDSMNFLVSSSPLSMGEMIRFNYMIYDESWKNLTTYLKGQEH
jgi:Dimerisation domain